MNLITPSRVKIYCAVILATNFSLLLVSAWCNTNYQVGGDYQAFYNAGIIFNTQPHGRLYDLALQDALYESQAGDSKGSLPFAYAPFFVLPCAVSARLPYVWGYLAWSLGSILLLCAGYALAWRAIDLPNHWYVPGLLAALAFPPFEFYTLRGGQTAAFGFFALALAFFLHRNRREVGAGLALSLLLYKPPLLLLLLPMLAVTRQWRLLEGFVAGATVLGLLSLLLVGTSGLAGYVTVLKLFYQAGSSSTEIFQTWKYVDVGSAIRLLTDKPPGPARLAILIVVFPFFYFAWRRLGTAPLSWAIAIAGTLLLNLYSPIYDCTLLIFSAMCALPEKIGRTLLVVVFFVSFVTEPIARLIGLQMFTIVLAYLVWLLLSSYDRSEGKVCEDSSSQKQDLGGHSLYADRYWRTYTEFKHLSPAARFGLSPVLPTAALGSYHRKLYSRLIAQPQLGQVINTSPLSGIALVPSDQYSKNRSRDRQV